MTSGPPELPPRIDRANKPPRNTVTRSAQERLFGVTKDTSDPPNYINATPHHRPANSSLERHNPNKTVIYTQLYFVYSKYFKLNIINHFIAT